MVTIDETTEFGSRITRRLSEDGIIWLTTVAPDLTPQPTPVWFFWNGERFLIFSQPQGKKLRNIRLHPKVALNFNSNKHGGDVVVLIGDAQILEAAPETELKAYLHKYDEGIRDIGMDVQSFVSEYSVAIQVIPSRVRGE